tara:strand:+ start:566 stop:1015 length:450 start_codon:yes stop_codon:yes gene_type:complete
MVKITLRMNLFDFLNSPHEEAVIEKLEEMYSDKIKYYLRLWYEDDEISNTDLKQFLLKYESRLHFKTTIKVGREIKVNDFVWFDIISQNYVDTTNRIRFQYTYSSKEDILKGLDEFHKCATFCTSDKPAKKQKRNDYESSNRGKQTIYK